MTLRTNSWRQGCSCLRSFSNASRQGVRGPEVLTITSTSYPYVLFLRLPLQIPIQIPNYLPMDWNLFLYIIGTLNSLETFRDLTASYSYDRD